MEILGVLFLGGCVWWWRHTVNVQTERDIFFATMALRKSMDEFPNGKVNDHIDTVAYQLVVFRPRLSPSKARLIVIEATRHIAAGSKAWNKLTPTPRKQFAKPLVRRKAGPSGLSMTMILKGLLFGILSIIVWLLVTRV
jgi:hypothetical protein